MVCDDGSRRRREDSFQPLCRGYLRHLMGLASKYGIGLWLYGLLESNKRGECKASECEMLSRLCDDSRVRRGDVPKMLGLSYRECVEGGVFARLKSFPKEGIYSKVSVIGYASTLKDKKRVQVKRRKR